MSDTRISLLVLKTANLPVMVDFYRAVGLSFVEEQHGSGPMHYSCQRDGVVVELYPGSEGTAPDRKAGGATMLGFSVASLDATIASLKSLGVETVNGVKATPWGKRAVVLDPDGRAVDLTEIAGT